MADEQLTAEEKAQLAEIRAANERARVAAEKARRLACIEKAHEATAKAAELIDPMDDGVTDEERIETMGLLREAINHLNEAG